MQENETRNPDGTWKEGQSGNPEGKNGHRKTGYVPYGIRSSYLLEKYTPEQIEEIVTNKKARKGISTYDLIILTHLASTFAGKDRRQEREALLDRIEGKATQPVKFSGDKDNPVHVTVTLPPSV